MVPIGNESIDNLFLKFLSITAGAEPMGCIKPGAGADQTIGGSATQVNPNKSGIGEKAPTFFKTILHHDA